MVDKDKLDFHADSGAGSYEEKQKDGNHPQAEQSKGDVGATTFDATDAAPTKEVRFKQLKKRHHEHWETSGKEANDTDVAYDARLVCNRLELSDVQQARSLKLISNYRKEGTRYELTILAVVSYVLNEGGRWVQRTDGPHADPLSDVYHDLIDAFDVEKPMVRKVRNEISDDN